MLEKSRYGYYGHIRQVFNGFYFVVNILKWYTSKYDYLAFIVRGECIHHKQKNIYSMVPKHNNILQIKDINVT